MEEEKKITVSDEALRRAAGEGMDEFLRVFTDRYLEVTGGQINAETMPLLGGMQHTLLGYRIFCEEVNEGGFVQLIQNGYGPYIFLNPFAKAMRLDEDEFMAMYERYEEFDDLEEQFMDMEEEVTGMVAHYVDEHLDEFAEVV